MDYKALFKKMGIKSTPARVKLYEYLLTCGHITSEDVFSWAKKNYKNYNRATIYNTLNSFESVGLLVKFKLPNTNTFIYDTKTSPHFHFVDESSGEIIDLEPQDVAINIKKFKTNIKEIFVLGKKEG